MGAESAFARAHVGSLTAKRPHRATGGGPTAPSDADWAFPHQTPSTSPVRGPRRALPPPPYSLYPLSRRSPTTPFSLSPGGARPGKAQPPPNAGPEGAHPAPSPATDAEEATANAAGAGGARHGGGRARRGGCAAGDASEIERACERGARGWRPTRGGGAGTRGEPRRGGLGHRRATGKTTRGTHKVATDTQAGPPRCPGRRPAPAYRRPDNLRQRASRAAGPVPPDAGSPAGHTTAAKGRPVTPTRRTRSGP